MKLGPTKKPPQGSALQLHGLQAGTFDLVIHPILILLESSGGHSNDKKMEFDTHSHFLTFYFPNSQQLTEKLTTAPVT